jgi:hypothetical protein
MPEQPRRFFEGRLRRQLFDRISADDELAALAVHMTEPRRRGHDTFESVVDHTRTLV